MYDYNCPDCNETRLQSDKNTRKINEVIDEVNTLIQVNNETVDFIEEKANEIVGEIAEIKVNEVIGELNTKIDNMEDKINKIYYNVSDFSDYVVNDDWAPAINKAIDVANNNRGRVLIDGVYEIKSTINVPNETTIEGIGFSWGGISTIKCVESGITALSINGVGITLENFAVICDNRLATTTHGIVQDNSNGWHSFNNYKNLRIVNFNGIGIKFDSIHDSVVENISVEYCGNKDYYAFWVTSHNDTTNHCIFNRIQVEQSYEKAMYIDDKVLSCNFYNIHSERTNITDTSIYTHILQGNRTTYDVVRIENSTEIKPHIKIGGETTVYNTFFTDGHVVSSFGVGVRYVIQNSYFSELSLTDNVIANLVNSNIGKLNVTTNTFKMINCEVGEYKGEYSIGEKVIDNSKISKITIPSTSHHYLKIFNSIIEENVNVEGSYIEYVNTTFKHDVTLRYCALKLTSCTIQGNITIEGIGDYFRLIRECHIQGNVSRPSGSITAINNVVEGNGFYNQHDGDKICNPAYS